MNKKEQKKFATICTYYIADSDFFQKVLKKISNEEFSQGLDEMVEKLENIFSYVNDDEKEQIENNVVSFYSQFLQDDENDNDSYSIS